MTQTDCINFLLYFACEDQAVSDRFWNEKSTKKKKKKKPKLWNLDHRIIYVVNGDGDDAAVVQQCINKTEVRAQK